MPPQPHAQHRESQLASARRDAIAEILRVEGAISISEIEGRFAVSAMTARRDLAELAERGLAHRTHGGAVARPALALERSFDTRLDREARAKAALAEAAVELLGPRQAVFLDSSTSSYFIALRILELGLTGTILTNSLPIMQLVSAQGAAGLELSGIGGTLRPLTRSFVGPEAVAAVRGHFVERTFLSVTSIAGGELREADQLEGAVKQAMIEQAGEAVLLVDRTKTEAVAGSSLGALASVGRILAHGLTEEQLRRLGRLRGPVVERVG